MVFTNITGSGHYFTCCHREVEAGGKFSVPYSRASVDRGLRAAMSSGVLAWESEPGEPVIQGSPALPDPEAGVLREAAKARSERERVEAEERQREIDNAAVSANMARMGNFDVPMVTDYTQKVEAVNYERPITSADVITDGKPKSIADIIRHNKAIRSGVSGV